MNKKLILAFTVFTSVCTININSAKSQDTHVQSVAQQSQTAEQRATNQVKQLTKALTLSNNQVVQIKPLLLELNQKRDAMREAPNKRVAMKDMRDLISVQDDKMKTILNTDQYTKYQDIRDEAKDRMRGTKGRRE